MKDTPEFIRAFQRKRRRRRFFRRLARVLRWMLSVVFLLLFFTWILIQNQHVQNWALNKATTRISKDLNTEVKATHIDIDFFNKLILEDFFIADEKGDTLLYSQILTATFNTDLIAILAKRSLNIKDVHLHDALINISRDSGQYDNNLQFILDYISPEQNAKTTKEKQPFFLDVNSLHLSNVNFRKLDYPKGEFFNVGIPDGKIYFNEINLLENFITVDNIELDRLNFHLDMKKQFLLPSIESQSSEPPPTDSTKKEFKVNVDHIILKKGHFVLENTRKSLTRTKAKDKFDVDHLDVSNIDVSIDDFQYSEMNFLGKILNLSAKESCGFEVENLKVDETIVSSRRASLNGLHLITPNSELGDTLVFKYRGYPNFLDFENKVLMDAKFKKSRVAVKDLVYFAPALAENAFFVKNIEEKFDIDGTLKGRVKNLKGKDLKIKLGNGVRFKGDFSSRDINVRGEEILNLNIEQFNADIHTLRLLIPNFNPPSNFDKLENLQFSGRFDGFFKNFVSFGTLKTDLGNAKMDMKLDLKGGRKLASYSGNLSLIDFDLGTWTGNKDIGRVNFSSNVSKGVGLTRETVYADLKASIDDFIFKGYTYRNVVMNGELDKNSFKGKLSIDDKFINLIFDGTIDSLNTIPVFDFKAEVKNLDLHALNITKQDLAFAGKVDLNIRDRNLSKIEGTAFVDDFVLIYNGKDEYKMDSINIFSELDENHYRKFEIDSDILISRVNGEFDIQALPELLKQYLHKNYPEFAGQLPFTPKSDSIAQSYFDYYFRIPDTKNFTKLLDPKLDVLKDIVLKGYFNNTTDTLSVDLSIPKIAYDKIVFNDIVFLVEGNGSVSDIDMGIYHTSVNDKYFFDPVSVLGIVNRDTFNFGITATNLTNFFDNLNINGDLFLVEDHFKILFSSSDLVILQEVWDINEHNFIEFGKGFVHTDNFELTREDKSVVLQSLNDKGLKLAINNFDIEMVNDLWTYDKLDFQGKFNINAEVENLFELKNISAVAMMDTFLVNGDDWGVLNLKAEMPKLDDPIDYHLTITKDASQITAEGYYRPPPKVNLKNEKRFRNEFSTDVTISNHPLYIVEYFIGDNISDTRGRFDANITLDGQIKKPNINGSIRIYDNAQVTIDYLGTHYYIEEGTAKVSNNLFDVTGATIRDSKGNEAKLKGGIIHNHLKNFGLDLTATADEFLVLNTEKGDNDLYYGTGIGKVDVQFSGSFKQVDIFVNAQTLKGSELFIPVDSGTDASRLSFVKFINKKKEKIEINEEISSELRGVNFTLFLDLTPEAKLQLIFDEQAGDIIEGRGEGDLQIYVRRNGDFNMYGTYEIVQGNYLFTMMDVVKKPFSVRPGGTVIWDGDPFGATIDLEADYLGLSAAPYNFIFEYLNNEDVKREARKATNVDLTMLLKGPLMKPNIDFNIAFPKLNGELKSYTSAKLRTVGENQNELNRQVFGLLIIGGFLSPGTIDLAETGVNTLTELLSVQLSNYLTEIFGGLFTGSSLITDFGFDVNYRVHKTDDVDLGGGVRNIQRGNEVGLRMRYLISDKVSVNFGGNFDLNGNYSDNGSALTSGDIIVEYFLTEDQRLKVRFYQLYDQTFEGPRNKTGLGLSFSEEFDSISEYLKSRKEKRQKKRQEKKQKKMNKKKAAIKEEE